MNIKKLGVQIFMCLMIAIIMGQIIGFSTQTSKYYLISNGRKEIDSDYYKNLRPSDRVEVKTFNSKNFYFSFLIMFPFLSLLLCIPHLRREGNYFNMPKSRFFAVMIKLIYVAMVIIFFVLVYTSIGYYDNYYISSEEKDTLVMQFVLCSSSVIGCFITRHFGIFRKPQDFNRDTLIGN